MIGQLFDRKEFNLPLPEPLYENGPILPYVMVGDEAFPTVVSEGDCWAPNFLIRNVGQNQKEVLMLDFQLARCVSPVCDLSFLLYSCTLKSFRDQYFDNILKLYHSELSDAIKLLGSDPERLYPLDLFMKEVKDHFIFGLVFPLTDYMMQPYTAKSGMTLEKRIYNYRLSRVRRTVENVFGIMASQWRLLRRPILAKVTTATKMVQAIVCLHNWLRKHEQETYVTQELADWPLADGNIRDGSWRKTLNDNCAFTNIKPTQPRAYSLRAANIREEFCMYFNEEGEVGWQNIQIYK
ncbi:hypothetical protein DMN91_004573 [Ooceraea biroi]|uniref:CHK kinase-like domain-containing protein n=1 Tax=Ooceraea biroi TaxID=2015173 RepID=A0A3L8DPD4_OOCBI|nr:hypothetical protein DMN91_004573 [Ooceraea biroi]